MPLVFLSYHTDDGGPYVDKLHADLVDRLYQQWGEPKDGHVFRDKPSIKLGERWPDELGEALARANLLLCLFSPVYFTRPWCGKEVAFFQQRLETYREQNKLRAAPPLILPILWVPERKGGLRFPDAFRTLQWTQDFPESYARVGLQQIIKQVASRYAADYEDILDKIVGRILEVIEDAPLPPHEGPVDFDAIPNAFDPGSTASPKPPPTPARGPKRAIFFVVAGPRGELEKAHLRKTLASYGESGADWDPFSPPPDPWPIGSLAQHVASTPDLNLTSEIVLPSDDLIERLEKARADNNLVVFIVDPWTLRIQEYSDRMREYDRRDFLNSTVLIAANEDDAETRQCADLLETAIRGTFENKATDQKRVRWSRVSREQLQQDLRDALLEVRKRIVEQAEVKRKLEADRVFVKPVISANRG